METTVKAVSSFESILIQTEFTNQMLFYNEEQQSSLEDLFLEFLNKYYLSELNILENSDLVSMSKEDIFELIKEKNNFCSVKPVSFGDEYKDFKKRVESFVNFSSILSVAGPKVLTSNICIIDEAIVVKIPFSGSSNFLFYSLPKKLIGKVQRIPVSVKDQKLCLSFRKVETGIHTEEIPRKKIILCIEYIMEVIEESNKLCLELSKHIDKKLMQAINQKKEHAIKERNQLNQIQFNKYKAFLEMKSDGIYLNNEKVLINKQASTFAHKVICFLADRKSTRLNSSHSQQSRMPSSA